MTTYKPSHSHQGFILVAVIWLLAALSIFAVFFSERVEEIVNGAFVEKHGFQQKLDELSTEAVLIYAASTTRMTLAGIDTQFRAADQFVMDINNPTAGVNEVGGEIHLNTRPYLGLQDTLFSIQDEGGLLSLTHFPSRNLQKLLVNLGVEEQNAIIFIARLKDYTGKSDLMSLNGATSSDYERAGWELPANALLTSPFEVLNVLQWQELMSKEQITAFIAATTTKSPNPYNFNTMPTAVLSVLPDMTESDIEQILGYRQQTAFRGLIDVNSATGSIVNVDPTSVAFFPSAQLRVKIWHPNSQKVRWIGLELTPVSRSRPWFINYAFTTEDPSVLDVEPNKQDLARPFEKEPESDNQQTRS